MKKKWTGLRGDTIDTTNGKAVLPFPFGVPGVRYLVWYFLCLAVNLAYNVEPLRVSSNCGPWEVPTVISGYSLVSILSCLINGIPLPPVKYWVHVACLVGRTQLWTEYMDYEPDLACGRKTTICLLGASCGKKEVHHKGKARASRLVLFSLVLECFVV